MSYGTRESAFTWVFGTAVADGLRGTPNNVLGSTGAGVAFNTHGMGSEFSFYVETDAASTCSYQIRTGRSSGGPWAVVSSGTLSTGAVDLIQMPGPFKWLSPRVKTLSTSGTPQVVVRMEAV